MFTKAKLNKIKEKINKDQEDLSFIFYALGDKRRLKILKLLLEYKNLCVSDIAYILGISIAAVSEHMKILKMSGLVNFQKRGKMVCYQVNLNNKLSKNFLKLIKGRKN
jgi:ArsR family transcriptional regulator